MQNQTLEERKIKFEDASHKYTDELGLTYKSVTTLIHDYVPPFDAEYWTLYSAVRDSGHKVRPQPETRQIWVNGVLCTLDEIRNSKSLVLAYTEEEIQKRWKDITNRSLARGNETHDYLEDEIHVFSGGKSMKIEKVIGESLNSEFKYKVVNLEELAKSPLQFKYPSIYDTLVQCIEKGYILYAERRIYHSLYLIAGTIDVLAVKDGKFVIIDWKTNKDEIKFESGYYKKKWAVVNGQRQKVKTDQWVKKDERMLAPLDDIAECVGSHYTLQLSLYAYLCECWGMECVGLILFHIRRTDKRDYPPVYYNIHYAKEHVHRMLGHYVVERMKKANDLERQYLRGAELINKLPLGESTNL